MKKILLLSLIITSCTSLLPGGVKQNDSLHATLWQQTSGELTALSYQAYNLAKVRIHSELKKPSKKPRAIIVDVDETVLDNSPYQGKLLKENSTYNKESWNKWIEVKAAPAIAGAVDLLNFAAKNDIKTFYITNRSMVNFEATYENLLNEGFPISKEQLMPKPTSDNSKEERRLKVEEEYNVIMYMGDSLGDFNKEFEKVEQAKRKTVVEKYRYDFGGRYIILPNPMYGEWKDSIYDYQHSLPESEKKKKEQEVIKSY